MIPKKIKLMLTGSAIVLSAVAFAGTAETEQFALNTRLGAKATAATGPFLSRYFTENASDPFGPFSTFSTGFLLFLR